MHLLVSGGRQHSVISSEIGRVMHTFNFSNLEVSYSSRTQPVAYS